MLGKLMSESVLIMMSLQDELFRRGVVNKAD